LASVEDGPVGHPRQDAVLVLLPRSLAARHLHRAPAMRLVALRASFAAVGRWGSLSNEAPSVFARGFRKKWAVAHLFEKLASNDLFDGVTQGVMKEF
jgi:hypothetical protein